MSKDRMKSQPEQNNKAQNNRGAPEQDKKSASPGMPADKKSSNQGSTKTAKK